MLSGKNVAVNLGYLRLAMGGLTAFFMGLILLAYSNDKASERTQISEEETARLQQKVKDLQESQVFLAEVGDIFLDRVVSVKANKVAELCKSLNQGSVAISDLCTALNPQEQIAAIMSALWSFLRHRPGSDLTTPVHSLRVALFAERNDYLEPIESSDGSHQAPIRSPLRVNREKFNLKTAANECFAVYTAHVGEICKIDDVEKNTMYPFTYFQKEQSERIKSIACLPATHPRSGRRFVISIDSSQRLYFNDSWVEGLRILSKHLYTRLLFEIDMEEMLSNLQGV